MVFKIDDFKLWSPEEPNLYEIKIDIGSDSITRKIGFRKAEFREDGLFYLNGKKTRIRGVNRHEDVEGKGWAIDEDDDYLDAEWIKKMGANGVRLAHGPHADHMLSVCDEKGIMVYAGIPFVNELRSTPE